VPGNWLKVARRVSATVLENSSILVNLSQSMFYRFSATVAENLEIAEKGLPLMKEMRLVFLHYWTVLYIRGNLRTQCPQTLKSPKKQYRQANS